MITSDFLKEVSNGFDGSRSVHADFIATDDELFTVRVKGMIEATEGKGGEEFRVRMMSKERTIVGITINDDGSRRSSAARREREAIKGEKIRECRRQGRTWRSQRKLHGSFQHGFGYGDGACLILNQTQTNLQTLRKHIVVSK